jgi:predicted MFS family arabinose efflux permease
VAVIVLSLLGLFCFAEQTALAALFVALASFGLGGLWATAQSGVIKLGPRNGTAWFSMAFNGGIASGPLIGGLVLETSGLRATPLAGALIAAAALLFAASPSHLLARPAAGRLRRALGSGG